MPKEKRPVVGRPPTYKTAGELQKKIEEYFRGGYRTKAVIVKRGGNDIEIELPMITITDLVLFLGFADRASFYDYEKQKKFTHTIKKARTFIEREYEEMLKVGNPTGAIFALKNFGWTDKTEQEVYGKDGGPLKINILDRNLDELQPLKKTDRSLEGSTKP